MVHYLVLFYVCAGFIFSAFIVQAGMIIYWPETRISLNAKRKEKERLLLDVDPATWKWKKERIKYNDYVKLGKAFGHLLTARHYQWVTYFDKLFALLDSFFPELSIDSLQEHLSDIQFIKEHALETKHDWQNLKYQVGNRLYM